MVQPTKKGKNHCKYTAQYANFHPCPHERTGAWRIPRRHALKKHRQTAKSRGDACEGNFYKHGKREPRHRPQSSRDLEQTVARRFHVAKKDAIGEQKFQTFFPKGTKDRKKHYKRGKAEHSHPRVCHRPRQCPRSGEQFDRPPIFGTWTSPSSSCLSPHGHAHP